MVLRPFRLLNPVRFPRHSPRRSPFPARRADAALGALAATVRGGSAVGRKTRAMACIRRDARNGCNDWRSWLRLLFRRRRLHWLWHRRQIRRRLGPRRCLGALDDALRDNRASHRARALKLGTRGRRGLLQTSAPATCTPVPGRRQEHQTGGVEPLDSGQLVRPDQKRKGSENHCMGNSRIQPTAHRVPDAAPGLAERFQVQLREEPIPTEGF